MVRMHITKVSSAKSARGFALVATISVMVLLVMMALAMLGLSTLELRSSQNNRAMAEAQANARLALLMAIGELQKQMGPDSRISAPHDVGSPSGGHPHWVAVYDAWKLDQDAQTPVNPASRNPEFRGWLVSGSSGSTAEMALMLGPGSLGDDSVAADQVKAPTQDVSAGTRRGRVAWWVSDESAKAKINAGPESTSGSVSELADLMLHAQSPPNVGHKAFPQLADFDWQDGQRGSTVSTSQINLAASLGYAGLGESIHDLTVHSAGVLTDVSAGRLKRDLSNLLVREIKEMEHKPLYLADGRINRFAITGDGAVTNAPGLPQNGNGGNRWGINLEELSLYHNIHREIDWSEDTPMLVTKGDLDSSSQDRFYMYGKPAVEAMQFILSLVAVPDGQNTDGDKLYKMQMMLDGMIALSNPNDVRLRFPPGLVKSVILLSFPYDMKLKIVKANGTLLNTNKTWPQARRVFNGYIEGGFGGLPADGFDLDPGEAAAFGSTSANGYNLNLRRGFVPSGGVRMTSWNLKAGGLKETAMVDFELLKVITARNGSNSNVYFQGWHGPGTPEKRIFEGSVISQGPNPDGEILTQFLPEKILPPQILPVKDFISSPQPVMLFSIVKNVERSSSEDNTDALPSRPLLLDEAARTGRTILRYGNVSRDLHSAQQIYTAAPMNYEFSTIAAGAGGRLVYHGGGRQPGVGGNTRVIKRRISLAPPLSLACFEHAIACGFSRHFGSEPRDPATWIGPNSDPSTGALVGSVGGAPMLAKAIGNSWANPFIGSNSIFQSNYTDPSWLANAALWDAWFLSGTVDTSGLPSSSWMTDRRTAREQFTDFAEGGKRLRNKRFLFYPYTSPQQAISELFDGAAFKPSAINQLPNYLLVDGAFNVNTTSVPAWRAFLSSVRDHELITAGGAKKKFNHPFGTLGYAENTATSGAAGDWAGLRDLTDAEIKNLADAIVNEVKGRGPFLNLADFVNRRPDADNSQHRALGALQAAIDSSGLNDRFASGDRTVEPDDFQQFNGADTLNDEFVPARATGAAGYLSQAALLTAMGSQITVRGDTFLIRAYGDHRNASGDVVARVWCEAVVQRVPEYLDPTDKPEAQDGWPNDSDKLTVANATFGRKFEIRSFRWLSPEEV